MTSHNAHSGPINLSVLHDAAGGDEALVLELLGMFQRVAPPTMAAIEQAVRVASPREVGASTHDLKGTAMLIGADRLVQLSQELEASSRLGASPLLPQLTAAVRQEFDRVAAAILNCMTEAENAARAK